MQTLSAPSKLSSQNTRQSRPRAFILPAGFSGCAWWRFRLPFAKLQKLGCGMEIIVADNAEKHVSMAQIQRFTDEADIVAMQAPGNMDGLMLIQMYRSTGKRVVVDYDDYSFDLSPGNPRYAELGIKECEVLGANGEVAFKWRDGENGFNLRANVAKYEMFLRCVKEADLVTVTTDYLAEKFRRQARAVAICPNSIDFDLWKPIKRPPSLDGQVRVGWFGGDSHLEDLAVFKTLLPRLCRKYPQVKIVISSSPVPQWKTIFSEVPNGQLEWHNWAELKHYTLLLASRQWDVGLIPLAENEFSRCKSNIKVLELAALRVPVVAQAMIPYSNYVRHGETGFLARSEEEWFEHACGLIESRGLRESVGEAAYADAFADYNLDSNCRMWEKAYTDLRGAPHGDGKT